MAELPFETRTLEQLTPLTALSPDALTAVQEPGGPVGRVSIKQLLGRLVQTDTAKETRADLLADLAHDEPAVALVFADPDPAKNGWYRKTGMSGAGTWTQFEKLSAFAAAEIAEYVTQASDAADVATSAADVAQALVNFRKTLAEGVADFAVGAFFSSAETGELRIYERIAIAPYYDDLGDGVAPLTQAILLGPDGAARVGFRQLGFGAVDRTVEEKAREIVSLGDFLLVTGGNPRLALERASAVGSTVNIFGGIYEFDQAAQIAADTTIIGHGCTIKPAAGYTDPNLMTFLGSGALEGTGFFVGAGMPWPTITWAGAGIPVGSAVHIAGPGDEEDRAYSLKVKGWTFSGFPGGLIYAKWVIRLEVDGCTFFDNQKASVQWKLADNYANIGTTNAGTSTDPIGELITDHGIQVYQSTEAIVTGISMVDIRSKGISLNVDYATLQGNVMKGGSPRHVMEHLTGCISAVSTGNSYDGGPDKGDAIKPVNCVSVTLGGGSIRNSHIGYYMQDCERITLMPIGMENVANAYYPAHSNVADADMAIVGHVGEIIGDGTGNFLTIASDAAAVAAGYKMSIRMIGGHARGFAYGMFHATPGWGMVLDIALIGGIHFENCAAGLDLRARNIEIGAKFTSVFNSISIGSTLKTSNFSVTPSEHCTVKAVFANCTGTHCRVGAQAVSNLQFETMDFDLQGDGGARILAFGVAATHVDTSPSDSIKLVSAKVRGFGQTTIASSVYFDGGGLTFKASLDVAIVDGAAGPNNITFANAATVTGDFKNRICGITGAHGLTL